MSTQGAPVIRDDQSEDGIKRGVGGWIKIKDNIFLCTGYHESVDGRKWWWCGDGVRAAGGGYVLDNETTWSWYKWPAKHIARSQASKRHYADISSDDNAIYCNGVECFAL